MLRYFWRPWVRNGCKENGWKVQEEHSHPEERGGPSYYKNFVLRQKLVFQGLIFWSTGDYFQPSFKIRRNFRKLFGLRATDSRAKCHSRILRVWMNVFPVKINSWKKYQYHEVFFQRRANSFWILNKRSFNSIVYTAFCMSRGTIWVKKIEQTLWFHSFLPFWLKNFRILGKKFLA